MIDGSPDTIQAAKQYFELGLIPIPIPPKEKAPTLRGWNSLGATNAQRAFENHAGNVGLLLGDPSGGLVDVDIDCPVVLPVAAEILPKTGAVHGRPGNPGSHYWYRVKGTCGVAHQRSRAAT